jgi:hypothetical protein
LHGGVNGFGDQSRKRSYNDREGINSRDTHYPRGGGEHRQTKQMRRGSRSGPDGTRTSWQNPSLGPLPAMPPMPQMPGGFPPFDPNNPLAAIMAMQAMGLPPLPGFPGLPPLGSPTALNPPGGPVSPSLRTPTPKRPGERCKDYDTKGFCALGSACPYEHGTDPIVIPRQAEGSVHLTNFYSVTNEFARVRS